MAATDPTFRSLPRNIWAVSLTSFFMDISSEMVINLLPLFLSNVLGVKTYLIGVIEGAAEATSSLLKLVSGRFSDKLGTRKWPAVAGYSISALAKPFFYFASSWTTVAAARWADRVGKGVRTAPRDALVADSIDERRRGLAFGFHRAADTAGAMLGLLIALGIVWKVQSGIVTLNESTFRMLVLASLLPAALSVLSLAVGAKEVRVNRPTATSGFLLRSLGKPFFIFITIVGIFELGNSSDAFLVLRAQERGVSVAGVLAMLATFNLAYALISTPAGKLSDRIGRRGMIIGGWLVYALIYFGFGAARTAWQVWILYAAYGLYYGTAYGASRALIADLVPDHLRGTAYGTYNAVIGVFDFPASLIAGILWQGMGSWRGFGPAAPFLFGGGMAGIATLMMLVWMPRAKTIP